MIVCVLDIGMIVHACKSEKTNFKIIITNCIFQKVVKLYKIAIPV